MQPATRYGLVGLGGLGLLTAAHQVRGGSVNFPPLVDYLLGVAPNFAAAIAISFVLLSIWADQNKRAGPYATWRAYVVAALISGLGLLGWEFFQLTGDRLVFDPHDIAATIAGLAASTVLFLALRDADPPHQF